MFKTTLIASAIIFSSLSNADGLDILKKTPASKYDIGKLQLEIAAFMLTDKLSGEWVKDSNFDIKKFGVKETPENISFVMSFIGKAKHLTEQQCTGFLNAYSSKFGTDKLIRDIWPEISESDFNSIKTAFKFEVELISKENESFIVSC